MIEKLDITRDAMRKNEMIQFDKINEIIEDLTDPDEPNYNIHQDTTWKKIEWLRQEVVKIQDWINAQNNCDDDCECSEENKFKGQDTGSSKLPSCDEPRPDILCCSQDLREYCECRNQTLDEVEAIISKHQTWSKAWDEIKELRDKL